LTGDKDTLTGFPGDPNDEVFTCHDTGPPPEVGLGRCGSAKVIDLSMVVRRSPRATLPWGL
jgi:hypothetical protein